MMIEILIVLGIAAAIFFGILFLAAGWAVSVYNTVQTALQDIKGMWANVLTEYQRRADMYCNLARSIKASGKFEKETLTQVITARTAGFSGTTEEQMKKMKGFDALVSKLMVLVERYPQVQTTKQYESLNEEIRITEDRINGARTEYNKIVEDYNTYVNMFPTTLLAGLFKFKNAEFFKAEEYALKKPEIEL